MIVGSLGRSTTRTAHDNLAGLKCLKVRFRHYVTSASEAPWMRWAGSLAGGARGPGPVLVQVPGQGGGRFGRRGLARPASQPTSRVIRAATANDRIEADIQLCAVKSISRPNDVHAETHQET